MISEKWRRLFQDDKGEVPEIEGLTLAGCKCLVDSTESETRGNVILVWLTIAGESGWLRIFIDGTYCGIDRYSYDESADDYDEEEDLVLKNYDGWVENLTIAKASVFNNHSSADRFIKLEILLSNKSKIELISNKDGKCRLNMELINS